MSKIHILESDGNGRYHVLLHVPIPNTPNTAGVPWPSVVVLVGLNKTVLTIGNGVGQMTTLEKQDIDAGNVLEIATKLLVESGDGSGASILAMANAAINDFKADFQRKYKLYGMTQG